MGTYLTTDTYLNAVVAVWIILVSFGACVLCRHGHMGYLAGVETFQCNTVSVFIRSVVGKFLSEIYKPVN